MTLAGSHFCHDTGCGPGNADEVPVVKTGSERNEKHDRADSGGTPAQNRRTGCLHLRRRFTHGLGKAEHEAKPDARAQAEQKDNGDNDRQAHRVWYGN